MGGSGMFGFGTSSSKPKDMTPNEWKAMRGDIADQVMNYMGGGGPQYQGPFAAQMGDAEAAALNDLNNASRGIGATEQSAEQMILDTLGGKYMDPESNPYLRATADAAKRGLTESLDQADLESRSLFSRAGHKIQESSPFATAQALLGRSYANAVGDVETKIFGENYQQERDRQGAAVGQAGELESFRFQRGLENLKSQALPRLIEDLGIERGIAEFNRFVEDIMEAMGLGGALAAPDLGQTSKSFEFKTSGGGGAGGGGSTE